MDMCARDQESQRFLRRFRSAELAALFYDLNAGPLPRGRLRGQLMAVTGLDFLPRSLSAVLYGLLALPLNPWRGKLFDEDHGSNLWFGLRGLRFGHYRIRQAPGADGQASVWLDYDQPENPAWLRGIRGEARELAAGRWLCRMHWQSGQQLSPLLWFTLSGAAHAA